MIYLTYVIIIFTMKRTITSNSHSIYEEVYSHCRWKTILCMDVLSNPVLQEENIRLFSNNTFEEIFINVKDICDRVKGIGPLSRYDITSAICRYNNINIDKVYIVGGGPKRAITFLKLTSKIQKQKILGRKRIGGF